jgi:hypothetical protein
LSALDPVQAILEFARKYAEGVAFDETDAEQYVANRLALAKDPNDPEAKRIAGHFRCALYLANDDRSFAYFLKAPECPLDCPECRAHDERYRDSVLARFEKVDGQWRPRA